MRYALIGGMLFLAACVGTAETRLTNTLAITCDSAAVLLTTMREYGQARRLKANDIVRIDAAKSKVDLICLPGSTIPTNAISTVNAAIALFETIRDSR